MVNNSNKLNCTLLSWAIKMTATASYNAVPSFNLYNIKRKSHNYITQTIVIVAPKGNTNRVTRLSIFRLSSRDLNVTGNVAPLKALKTLITINEMSN